MRTWAKRLHVFGALALLLTSASCKKEVIPPDIKEEPKFYAEGRFNGLVYNYAAGKDDYRVIPEAGTFDFFGIARIPAFSCTFTNEKDTFLVMIIGDQFGSPRDVADEYFLDSALALGKFLYGDFLTFPGAYIGLRRGEKVYYSDSEQIPGAHFTILKTEDYQPSGAPHAMRKVEVSFKCTLKNDPNPSDQIVIEDGKGTLLFTYEVK
jgi:hypothetical protein